MENKTMNITVPGSIYHKLSKRQEERREEEGSKTSLAALVVEYVGKGLEAEASEPGADGPPPLPDSIGDGGFGPRYFGAREQAMHRKLEMLHKWEAELQKTGRELHAQQKKLLDLDTRNDLMKYELETVGKECDKLRDENRDLRNKYKSGFDNLLTFQELIDLQNKYNKERKKLRSERRELANERRELEGLRSKEWGGNFNKLSKWLGECFESLEKGLDHNHRAIMSLKEFGPKDFSVIASILASPHVGDVLSALFGAQAGKGKNGDATLENPQADSNGGEARQKG